jgi:Pretoxin HINT domain/A nuclease of the HNH/ENDO VII superfamily with conserved WHH
LITVPNGYKPIELITPKDSVIAYDEIEKKFTTKKVNQTFKKVATQLVMLYALGGKLIASPTPEHPFFVKNTYKPAKELVKGDTLLSKTNNFIVVDKVVAVDSVLDVYNFEVEDSHNYLVGEDGVLVHNLCNPDADYILSIYPSFNTLRPALSRRNPIANSEIYDFFVTAKNAIGQTVRINYDKSHLPDLKEFTFSFGGKPMAFKHPNNKYYAGDNPTDFDNANDWLDNIINIPGLTFKGKNPIINGVTYTWHHHQDGKTLMLVEQTIHQASLPHVGKAFLPLLQSGKLTFDSPF